MWADIADDPNAPEARQHRKAQLDAAWRPEGRDRLTLLRDECRGAKVLDVGCVGHASRIGSDRWLHGHLAEVAGECVGIDTDAAGVATVRAAGYDAVVGDLTADPPPLLDRAPFDVVVAGEVIEHLPCPQSLLAFAHRVLRVGGRLLVTTPNPYAPGRVRAGQRGAVIENVDHVVYAFPSGMAEMADRTGLRLVGASTVDVPFTAGAWRSAKVLVAASLRRARGERGADPIGRLAVPFASNYLSPMEALAVRYRGSRDRIGETSVYVLARPADDGGVASSGEAERA